MMPEPEYRAHVGVSISELKNLSGGVPAACLAYREQKREVTPAMQFGTLCHTAILEPEKFKEGVSHFVRPEEVDGRTKEGKAWLAAHDGLPCLKLTGDMSAETLKNMQEAVYAMPEAAETLNWIGHTEVAAFAECPLTGMQLKGRFDKLAGTPGGPRAIIDLKTTDDATFFERKAVDLGYHLQDSFYTRLAKLNGIEVMFIFVVVSTKAPHYVRIGMLSDQMKTRNEQRIDELLRTYSECSRRNFWPAYRINSDLSRVGLEQFGLFIKDL
jgi:hypothetical protein